VSDKELYILIAQGNGNDITMCTGKEKEKKIAETERVNSVKYVFLRIPSFS